MYLFFGIFSLLYFLVLAMALCPKKFTENSYPQLNNGRELTDRAKVCFVFEYLTVCVSISVAVCMFGYVR